jgi:ABC-type uncharacterized transport system permease subunit
VRAAVPYSPDLIRSVIAVMGGVLLYSVLDQVLETTLVRAMAAGPVGDMAAYFAVRNQPLVLVVKVIFSALMAVLAGYLSAKIAGAEEIQHGLATAAIQTASMVWGYTVGEFASSTPLWARIVLVLTTAPIMIGGAAIRRKARVALDEIDAASGVTREQQP